MTRDDIIRMAQEAGFEINSLGATYTSGWLPNLLESFANLVAAEEREACAKIVEQPWQGHFREVAAQIRARGKK